MPVVPTASPHGHQPSLSCASERPRPCVVHGAPAGKQAAIGGRPAPARSRQRTSIHDPHHGRFKCVDLKSHSRQATWRGATESVQVPQVPQVNRYTEQQETCSGGVHGTVEGGAC